MFAFKNIGEEVFLTNTQGSSTVEINGVPEHCITVSSSTMFTKNTNYNSKKKSVGGFLNQITEVFVSITPNGLHTILCFKAGSQWYKVFLGSISNTNDGACMLLVPYYNNMTTTFQGDFKLTKIGRGLIVVPSEYIKQTKSTGNPTVSFKNMEIGKMYKNANNYFVKIHQNKDTTVCVTSIATMSDCTKLHYYCRWRKETNIDIFKDYPEFTQSTSPLRYYVLEIPNNKRISYSSCNDTAYSDAIGEIGRSLVN